MTQEASKIPVDLVDGGGHQTSRRVKSYFTYWFHASIIVSRNTLNTNANTGVCEYLIDAFEEMTFNRIAMTVIELAGSWYRYTYREYGITYHARLVLTQNSNADPTPDLSEAHATHHHHHQREQKAETK